MDYKSCAKESIPYLKWMRKSAAFRNLGDLAEGEVAVLLYLSFERDGLSAGELTELFGVASSRTAAILNRLEKKGLAKRESDPSDRRRIRVFVTPDGSRVAKEKYEDTVDSMAELLSSLGEEDAKSFLRIVRKASEAGSQKK